MVRVKLLTNMQGAQVSKIRKIGVGLIICLSHTMFAQGTGGSFTFPGFSVSAPLQSGATSSFIAGVSDTTASQGKPVFFGLSYGAPGKNGKTSMLRIVDAANGKVLKDITVDEYFGEETDTWNAVP